MARDEKVTPKVSHPVKIQPVSNGWIVTVEFGAEFYGPDAEKVFQSFEELMKFLESHFHFRCSELDEDDTHAI